MEPLDDDDERQAGVLPPGLVGPMVGGMHGKEEASAAKDFCCSKVRLRDLSAVCQMLNFTAAMPGKDAYRIGAAVST